MGDLHFRRQRQYGDVLQITSLHHPNYVAIVENGSSRITSGGKHFHWPYFRRKPSHRGSYLTFNAHSILEHSNTFTGLIVLSFGSSP